MFEKCPGKKIPGDYSLDVVRKLGWTVVGLLFSQLAKLYPESFVTTEAYASKPFLYRFDPCNVDHAVRNFLEYFICSLHASWVLENTISRGVPEKLL